MKRDKQRYTMNHHASGISAADWIRFCESVSAAGPSSAQVVRTPGIIEARVRVDRRPAHVRPSGRVVTMKDTDGLRVEIWGDEILWCVVCAAEYSAVIMAGEPMPKCPICQVRLISTRTPGPVESHLSALRPQTMTGTVNIAMGRRLLANRESMRGTEINDEWIKANAKLERWLIVNGPLMLLLAPDLPGGCSETYCGLVCILPSDHVGKHDWLVVS